MIFDLPQVPCSRLLAGRKLLELFCSEPAQVDVNHRDQQQDVDLVVQLDDQLLDVGVLDLPPCEVVVGRVDEIGTPGERFLTVRIIIFTIIVLLLKIIIVMIYL